MSTTVNPDARKAQRFFWCWLIAATAASITGNVSHALLATSTGNSTANPIVAAALAVVPPVVQVGATHGVHVLVNARITGAAYRTALAITVALVVFAFVLSFEALRELAIVYAGMNPATAWLWPLVIDLSITGSTVSLLALTRAHRNATMNAAAEEQHAPTHLETPYEIPSDTAEAGNPAPTPVPALAAITTSSPTPETPAALAATERVASTTPEPEEAWAGELRNAEHIVNEGFTRIGRTKVAQVLHAHREGTPPGTIARKLNVGYRTVVRILDHHTTQPAPV